MAWVGQSRQHSWRGRWRDEPSPEPDEHLLEIRDVSHVNIVRIRAMRRVHHRPAGTSGANSAATSGNCSTRVGHGGADTHEPIRTRLGLALL